MAQGNWTPGEEKTRPGLYNRFISTALSRIKSGPRGIVGIPIRADWGPLGEITYVSSESEVNAAFGASGEGCTTYLLNRILLAGKKYKPSKIAVYRMANNAAKASVTISGAVKFEAKYHGARGNDFSYVISANIVDNTLFDVKFYEKSVLFAAYTVSPDDIAGLVKAINDTKDTLIIAAKLGDTALTAAPSTPFTGGNSGLNVTPAQYLAALDAFEPLFINILVLDGVTISDIQASVRSWVTRVREAGKEVIYVMGGSTANDADPAASNQRSVSANNKAIVNVVNGVKNSVRSYNSAETACQIAGLIAGTPINKSITYKELEDVDDITNPLTDEQIKTALKSGSLVLSRDTDPETLTVAIKVEQGINTLTSYSGGESAKFSKIRCIRTLDAIDYDTGYWAAKNVIGELDNNADGQATLLSGIKLYLETLAASNAIDKNYLAELDTAFVSEGDTVYLNTQALTVDSIEKIFNSIYV
jgi:hypothetical protein